MRALALALLLAAGGAAAHNGVVHKTPEEAAKHLEELAAGRPNLPDSAFPFPADMGGPFELTDQFGNTRTEADPDGQMQLLFFGYAKCIAICDTALPRMAEVTDILGADGINVTPILVTVDPERDTVEGLAEEMPLRHERMIGLTGTEEKLADLRKAFHVEAEPVFEDPEYGTIFSHGSFVYLLDAEGEFLTLLPPILSVERMAEIVASHY